MGIYPDATDFLRESNNIENVWSDFALEKALLAWDYMQGKKVITPWVVKQTHSILMTGIKECMILPEEIGVFKKGKVTVGGKETKPWYVIPELMDNWCKDVNEFINSKLKISNVRLAESEEEEEVKQFHIRYEKIHPFADGNGRTGRIFMNWMRHRLYMPLLTIRASEKEDYYKWFR